MCSTVHTLYQPCIHTYIRTFCCQSWKTTDNSYMFPIPLRKLYNLWYTRSTNPAYITYLLLPVMEDHRQLKHVVAVFNNTGEFLPAHPQFLVTNLHDVECIVSCRYESLSHCYDSAYLLVLALRVESDK